MTPNHWTEQSLGDFAYWIGSDFTAQIETRLETEDIGKSEFAKLLNLSPSRVSQVLNDPGNLTLGNVVKYARALGMKVALVAYDDADPNNEKGPINAEVFTKCWERLGQPKDFSDLSDIKTWIMHSTVPTGETKATTDKQNIPLKLVSTAEIRPEKRYA